MELLRLAGRRARSQALLTAAIVCALSFSVGVLVAGPIFAAGSERAIVFAYLERSSPLSTGVFVTTLTTPTFELGQATGDVRSSLASLRISELTLQQESGDARVRSGGASVLAPLAYRDGLLAKVLIIEGSAPTGPDQVLVPQPVAVALGVGPGAVVQLRYSSTTDATVSGVYWVARGGDPLVFGNGRLLWVSSASTGGPLPMLTTRDGFASLTRSFGQVSGVAVEWDAQPDFAGLAPGDLPTLVDREAEAAASIRRALTGVSVSSDLRSLIPGAERVVGKGLAPMYIVVAVVGLVGIGVLLGVAVFKLDRQSFELAVLKTRGARTRELLALQVFEVSLAILPALALSIAIGFGLALVARAAHGPGLPGAVFPIAVTRSGVIIAAVGSLLGAVCLVLVSLPRLRQTVVEERRQLSRGDRPGWLRYPYEIVPLLAGALAFAELRRHGASQSQDGLDPFALAAPALLLVGGGVVAVRLLLRLARHLSRSADRSRSPSVYLALHRLPRSGANAALAMLIALSAGLFAFASSLRTTELTRNQQAARQQIGADWRLLVAPSARGLAATARLGARRTLAFYGSSAYSNTPKLALASVIGIDPASYAPGGWWQSEDASLPLSSVLSLLTAPRIGLPLPAGRTVLALEARGPAAHGLRLWTVLEQPDGSFAYRAIGALGRETRSYALRLGGATRLLSIVVRPTPGAVASLLHAGSLEVRFERLELSAGGATRTVDLSDWNGLFTGQNVVRTSAWAGGGLVARFSVVKGGPVGGIAPPSPAVPALVGGVGPGPPPSSAVLRVGSTLLPIHVAGSLNAFPAATEPGLPFVVVPIGSLIERANQTLQAPTGGAFAVLAMGTSSPVTAARAAGLQILHVSAASTIEAQLASRQQNLAIGLEFAASVAAAALAVLAFALGVYLGGRRHEYEFASLAALGGRAQDATRTLGVEHGSVLASSLIVGCALGLGILALALPAVAPRARVGVSAALLVDWPAIGTGAIVAGATLAGTLAVAARRIRRLATVALLRGEPT